MELNSVFDVARHALSAQVVRLNTISSNIANATSVSPTRETAYQPMRPVFETVYDAKVGRSTTRAREVVTLDREPIRQYRPDHPLANEEGYVFTAAVNTEEEMVEMLETNRHYQNILETVSTMRTLMARTVKMGQG
ncbi:MAG: flagellar basal body rod protein FlgC [Rhodobacteraceae bacterium]|nr:flagellar basal body rod protein FlgC [Paracoccaceae bacterium]